MRDNWLRDNETNDTVNRINACLFFGVEVDFECFRSQVDEPETGVR